MSFPFLADPGPACLLPAAAPGYCIRGNNLTKRRYWYGVNNPRLYETDVSWVSRRPLREEGVLSLEELTKVATIGRAACSNCCNGSTGLALEGEELLQRK
jgi:hypothetical protein